MLLVNVSHFLAFISQSKKWRLRSRFLVSSFRSISLLIPLGRSAAQRALSTHYHVLVIFHKHMSRHPPDSHLVATVSPIRRHHHNDVSLICLLVSEFLSDRARPPTDWVANIEMHLSAHWLSLETAYTWKFSDSTTRVQIPIKIKFCRSSPPFSRPLPGRPLWWQCFGSMAEYHTVLYFLLRFVYALLSKTC